MLSKIILSVSSKQATAGLWRMGRFVSCTQFANDEAGLAKYQLFVSSHPDSPIHIIADAVEEDYRLETMPHSGGRARNEMLQRKLGQLYRNNNYRAALFIGRESDKRRDDRILMMALTNSDLLTPWISVLEAIEAPIAGVYLVPMVSQMLVKTLKLKQPNLLLMTREAAGLRLTYFADQQLRLSRVTPLAGISEEKIQKLYLSEAERTRLYLISLRMVTRETQLHLVYPSIEPPTGDFASQLEATQGVSCEVIQPAALAKRVGLNLSILSRYPDLLHMHILAKSLMRTNLIPKIQAKNYQLLKTRFGLNIASIASVSVAAFFAVSSLWNTIEIKHKIEDASMQTHAQENLYLAVSSNFTKTPVPGSELKIAADLAQKFDSLSRNPQRLIIIISQALDTQPEIAINRMRWMQTEDASIKDNDSLYKDNAMGAVSAPLPPRPPSGLYELGFMDGEIKNFSGDYRAAQSSVEKLIETLRMNKQVAQVTILRQPVNTSSHVSLQGSTLDNNTQQQDPAHFELKLILKPETQPAAKMKSS
jgi:hypothetical protein